MENGDLYHLKTTIPNNTDTFKEKNIELFAVCHTKGAISVMKLTEFVFHSLSFHKVSFYSGVRQKYLEADYGNEDRQLEFINHLMNNGNKWVYSFELPNGKTETCEIEYYYSADVHPEDSTIVIDDFSIGGSNFGVNQITKYSKMLFDLTEFNG